MRKRVWNPCLAGALGEGRIDGLWGILGMLCGGALYAAIYPFMKAYTSVSEISVNSACPK